jgi:hypothetical protein
VSGSRVEEAVGFNRGVYRGFAETCLTGSRAMG